MEAPGQRPSLPCPKFGTGQHYRQVICLRLRNETGRRRKSTFAVVLCTQTGSQLSAIINMTQFSRMCGACQLPLGNNETTPLLSGYIPLLCEFTKPSESRINATRRRCERQTVAPQRGVWIIEARRAPCRVLID